MTQFLVTGGCGFIGRRLVANLVQSGRHVVRVIDNLTTGDRTGLAAVVPLRDVLEPGPADRHAGGNEVELMVGDITCQQTVDRAARGAEVIVHLAANAGVEQSIASPEFDSKTNVLGTLRVLEAARRNKVRRLVLASSGAPVGECEPPIHEELACHPVSPYGASKLAAEGYCSAYFHSFGIETVALRFGNVYGPGSGTKSSVVARFIRRALAGQPLEIFGDGRQTRDYIYVDDIVRAIERASLSSTGAGEVFQIATNRETTIHELLDVLVPILRARGVTEIRVEHADPRAGDVQRNYSDTSKARRLLGWQPETTLADGLQETVAWFVDRARLKPERSRSVA